MSMTAEAQATESQPGALDKEKADKEKAQKKQDIVRVVALGWSLIELLGRCFALEIPTPEKELEEKKWDGERMIMISPAFNSQKRLQDLVRFVQTLVEQLKLMDGKDHTTGKNKTDTCFLGTIETNINDLYLLGDEDKKAGKEKPLLGGINECLFNWDIEIRQKLQNNSKQFRNNYDFMNAYMVGKGFAALRWYHEPPKGKQGWIRRVFSPLFLYFQHLIRKRKESDTASDSISQATSIDDCFLATLQQRVQLLEPYLDTFAPLALAFTIKHWKKALVKQKIFARNKHVSSKLQDQADIWYDLLTAERDPMTYVTPSAISWRYTRKVLFFALPYVFLGIVLALGITVLIAYLIGKLWPLITSALNTSPTGSATLSAIGTGFSLLAGIASSIPATKALWQWVTARTQASAENASSKAAKSLVDVFWEAAQQDAINKAIYVRHRRLHVQKSVKHKNITPVPNPPLSIEPNQPEQVMLMNNITQPLALN
jgi:hypothetical protein